MNSKLPELPRKIKTYSKKIRSIELKKPKRPTQLKDVKKLRITTEKNRNDILIYPEVYADKWLPFVASHYCLVTRVHSMIGYLTKERADTLLKLWETWLKKWCKLNKLKLKIEKNVGH
jgi:hypothetical protein